MEGMRLKPDAILLQTDGHRKPATQRAVAGELPPLEPLHAGGTTRSPPHTPKHPSRR